jgi:hypothetical protein
MGKVKKCRCEDGEIDDEDIHNNFIVNNGKRFIINMDFDLINTYQYRELYDLLECVEEEHELVFRVNNNGGFTDILSQLCYYLLTTKAKTIAELHCAASCSSLFVLACDEVIVNPFSTIMFHLCFFTGLDGNLDDISNHIENERQRYTLLLNKICLGFLTEDEIIAILNSKSFFFNSEEINKRLKNRKISELRVR